MKKLLFLLTLLICNYAQANPTNQQEWIIKINEYRDYVMNKNPEAPLLLKSMLEKWKKADVKNKEKVEFTFNVLVAAEVYKNDFKKKGGLAI